MKRQSALIANNFKSSFLSCEKNQELIWRKLVVESKPYSDKLKRLLIVNTPDCLDQDQEQYQLLIDKYDLATMRQDGYLRVVPRIEQGEHAQLQSYILLEFDEFTPTENHEFRSSLIAFTIVCPMDQWELDDYKLRPHQIAGYIDGIMNETKLTGIGTLQFRAANQYIIDDNWGGILLQYTAVNGRGADDVGEAAVNNNWPSFS